VHQANHQQQHHRPPERAVAKAVAVAPASITGPYEIAKAPRPTNKPVRPPTAPPVTAPPAPSSALFPTRSLHVGTGNFVATSCVGNHRNFIHEASISQLIERIFRISAIGKYTDCVYVDLKPFIITLQFRNQHSLAQIQIFTIP